MSSLVLRAIALLTMLTDHLGYALYGVLPEPVYLGMRLVGRLAMPIFCFLVAEGLFHTRSASRYAFRLLLFGLLSEVPFDWFCSHGTRLFSWEGQNIFFTLFLGLLAIWLYDRFALHGHYLLSLLAVLFCAALSELIRSDYGMFGVLFIFVFYSFRDRPRAKYLTFIGVCLLLGLHAYVTARNPDLNWAISLCCASLAAWPLFLYNGRKGKGGKKLQMAFYAFYPAHLLLITLFVHGIT